MGVDRAIDITAKQRKIVTDLLERHLPNTTAWVYGSRAKWTSRPQSDLDLVVFATPEQNGRVSESQGSVSRKATCRSGWTCSCGTPCQRSSRSTSSGIMWCWWRRESSGTWTHGKSGVRGNCLIKVGRIVTGQTFSKVNNSCLKALTYNQFDSTHRI